MDCRFCPNPAVIIAEWRTSDGNTVVGTYGFCQQHRGSATNWSGQVTIKAVQEAP